MQWLLGRFHGVHGKNLHKLTWVEGSMSCSDQNLSVVRRRHRCCRKLFTFSSSATDRLEQFQPNLAQSILEWRGFKFVQMKGAALTKGRWLRNSENTLTHFKNLHLQIHRANFNQTWRKEFMGEEDSGLFKWRVLPFSRGI